MTPVTAISATDAATATASATWSGDVQAQLRLAGRPLMAGAAGHLRRTREKPGTPMTRGNRRNGCEATKEPSKLDELSSLLDMSADELARQVGSGKDLMDLLKSRGVSVERLRTILDNGDLVDVSA
jgi:hypothetical protein